MKNKYVKRTLSGILSFIMITSLTPNIKYYKNKNIIENSISFEENDNRKLMIGMLFKRSIYKNENLSDYEKFVVSTSFLNDFIYKYYIYIDDEAIINMCASAQTIRIKELNNLIKKYFWWSGSFNSFTNRYSTTNGTLSHEQLHAISKKGLFSTGLDTFVYGYGINEGVTALLMDSNSYPKETFVASLVSLTIGLDKLVSIYLSGNTKDLTNELEKYLSKSEVKEFIMLLDINVFSDYMNTFTYNNFGYKKENDYIKRINALALKMVEQKYGKDSVLSDFIVNSSNFTNQNNVGFSYTFSLDSNQNIITDAYYSVLEKKDILKQIRSVRYVYKLDEIKDINFGEWYNNSKDSLKNCKTLKK